MTPIDIENYILETFEEVYPTDTWGEKSFFVNPQKKLKRGAYFATIKEKDGANDKASCLDREGIFRFNMGLPKEAYLALFSSLPKRPLKGGIIEGAYNFQERNLLLPHPIYAWMGWVCILNPSKESFRKLKPLLEKAYNKALDASLKRLP